MRSRRPGRKGEEEARVNRQSARPTPGRSGSVRRQGRDSNKLLATLTPQADLVVLDGQLTLHVGGDHDATGCRSEGEGDRSERHTMRATPKLSSQIDHAMYRMGIAAPASAHPRASFGPR